MLNEDIYSCERSEVVLAESTKSSFCIYIYIYIYKYIWESSTTHKILQIVVETSDKNQLSYFDVLNQFLKFKEISSAVREAWWRIFCCPTEAKLFFSALIVKQKRHIYILLLPHCRHSLQIRNELFVNETFIYLYLYLYIPLFIFLKWNLYITLQENLIQRDTKCYFIVFVYCRHLLEIRNGLWLSQYIWNSI